MAYIFPTVADFRARFAPVFSDATAIPDARIQPELVAAGRNVDTTWTEGDYAEAIMQLAAHYLTLAGIGASATGGAIYAGGTVKRQEAADHKIEMASADGLNGSVAAGYPGDYGRTPYGRRYYDLLMQNQGGARVAAGPIVGFSPYATDWPCC